MNYTKSMTGEKTNFPKKGKIVTRNEQIKLKDGENT